MPERTFIKSSYSAESNCVEVSPAVEMWVSSYSGPTGGQCVEIGSADNYVLLGDTKLHGRPEQSYIHASPEAFGAFTEYAGAIALRDYADVIN